MGAGRTARRAGAGAAVLGLVAAALAVGTNGAADAASTGTTTAAATAATCPSGWGSTARTARSTASAPLLGVRAGSHACYDRLVLEFAGRVDGYAVRYVPAVLADGSGRPVPVAGGARLAVIVDAPAYGPSGVTYRPADPAHVVPVAGFGVFRQVAWAGSFEGRTTLALGVRARLPFRVSVLAGPGGHSRVVVDVARSW